MKTKKTTKINRNYLLMPELRSIEQLSNCARSTDNRFKNLTFQSTLRKYSFEDYLNTGFSYTLEEENRGKYIIALDGWNVLTLFLAHYPSISMNKTELTNIESLTERSNVVCSSAYAQALRKDENFYPRVSNQCQKPLSDIQKTTFCSLNQ